MCEKTNTRQQKGWWHNESCISADLFLLRHLNAFRMSKLFAHENAEIFEPTVFVISGLFVRVNAIIKWAFFLFTTHYHGKRENTIDMLKKTIFYMYFCELQIFLSQQHQKIRPQNLKKGKLRAISRLTRFWGFQTSNGFKNLVILKNTPFHHPLHNTVENRRCMNQRNFHALKKLCFKIIKNFLKQK